MKKISLQPAKEALATAEAPKKAKKSKVEKTDEKVAKSVVDKIKKEKDLMYLYPQDCTSAIDKKKFRASTRRELASRIKKIEKETDAEKKAKAQRLALKWAKGIYTPENLPTFA